MVDCSQVRTALLENRGPYGEALERHAAECPACRELLVHGAALGRLLAMAGRASSSMAEGDLAAAVARDLERDEGMLGRLRSRSTRWRTCLVTAIAILPVLAFSVGNPRALTIGRWVTVAFGVLLAVATDCLLAPLHRIRRRARIVAIALLALAVPAIRFLLIGSTTAPATNSGWACFAIGMLCSAPALALLHAVARRRAFSFPDLALASGIAGLGGNMALQLHCVDQRLAHLLAGHALIGLVWLAGSWLTLHRIERPLTGPRQSVS
jgi:hypothetical protein